MFVVVFRNERGQRVQKRFDSLWFCRRFVNKLRHSKKCELLSYPTQVFY